MQINLFISQLIPVILKEYKLYSLASRKRNNVCLFKVTSILLLIIFFF